MSTTTWGLNYEDNGMVTEHCCSALLSLISSKIRVGINDLSVGTSKENILNSPRPMHILVRHQQ